MEGAASAEEKARLEAELAELERLLIEEGLRVQADGSTVNFNLDTVESLADVEGDAENTTNEETAASQ